MLLSLAALALAEPSPAPHERAEVHAPAPPPPAVHARASHRPPPPRHRRAAPTHRPPPEPQNDVSIVLNVVDAPGPMLSVGGELALTRQASLDLHGGLGSYGGLGLYEVGGDVRGYFAGDFDRGLFLSGGVGLANTTPTALGSAATVVGGDLGGKVTLPAGLTLEGSVGLAAYMAEEVGVLSPTLKLGVGWSF